jgi:multiple sugar transport system permease protein
VSARRILRSDHVVGWAFAFPAVFLIVVFGIVPIIWSAVMSFQRNNLLGPPEWVGLQNYRALPKDPVFRTSITHIIVYTAIFVPLSVGGALFVAIALNRKIRGSAVPTAVFVRGHLDDRDRDMFVALRPLLAGEPAARKLGWPVRFFRVRTGPCTIIVVTVWGWIGFDVIIYLAALQGVPQELLEAAAIDGAGRWSILRNVTLPLLGPATLFLVVFSSINAIQLFDEVFFLTKGGPGTSTYTPVLYLYNLAFAQGIAGYAAAIAYALLFIILIISVIELWIGKRLVYYAS